MAGALNLSEDFQYLISSMRRDNSVVMYKIDREDRTFDETVLSAYHGEYPKDAMLFPDNRHLVSLNHESNTMTFFTVHPDTGLIVMNGPESKE